MKLYDPECKNTFVWPMIAKNAKPGQQTTYKLTKDPSPKMYEERGYFLAGPCQCGRYDEEGFYHTYRPAVDGLFPGKYFRVLQGDDYKNAKKNYERNLMYEKWGSSSEVAA